MTWTKISQVTDWLRWTKKNMSPALQQGVREWAEEELPKRFEFGNTNKYNYIPNTIQYENRKFKTYGNQPQLVVNGHLKDQVVNLVKVSSRAMVLTYPIYGRYQIENGRDFTKMRDEDSKEISKRFATLLRKWMNRKI